MYFAIQSYNGVYMGDLDKALADLGDIRSRLAAGDMFCGFGPAVIAMTGGLAIVTALAQASLPHVFAPDDKTFLLCWIIVAIVSIGLVGTEMIARTRRLHGGMADAMLFNAVEYFFPAGLAGTAIAAVLYQFAPEALWSLPGLWQILVAVGLFAATRILPRTINIVAAWYFLAGVTVLILSAQGQVLMPWAMGLPFGVGQLLMAAFLKAAHDEGDDEH